MLLEHVELMLETFVAGGAVPAVGEARDQLQHDLLAAAANRDRRMRLLHGLGIADRLRDLVVPSLECHAFLFEHRLHYMQAFLEHLEPRAHRREFVAVSLVLRFHPAGAVADFEPAVADVIDRAQCFGEQRGIAIRVAHHERTDPDFLGLRRQPGHQRETFMMVKVGHPARPHVIDQPDRMIAELLAAMRPVFELMPRLPGLR